MILKLTDAPALKEKWRPRMNLMGELRFRWAWIRWFLRFPGYRLGDPSLGEGGPRAQNRRLIRERYLREEPRREDF